jgi:hypothetical protein
VQEPVVVHTDYNHTPHLRETESQQVHDGYNAPSRVWPRQHAAIWEGAFMLRSPHLVTGSTEAAGWTVVATP